jgi:hypothetical protein
LEKSNLFFPFNLAAIKEKNEMPAGYLDYEKFLYPALIMYTNTRAQAENDVTV